MPLAQPRSGAAESELSEPEINEHDLTTLEYEHVVWLQIAVDQPLSVKIGQGMTELAEHMQPLEAEAEGVSVFERGRRRL